MLNLKVEITSEVDEKEWNTKLLENKSSTVYQLTSWARAYESFDSIPVFITVRNNNREIEGQLLALIHNELLWNNSNFVARTMGTKLKLRSTLTWFYGPIIHNYENANEIIREILDALEEVCVRNKVTIIRGSSHPFSKQSFDDIFTRFGYKLQQWATYIIDLNQTVEELYSSLDKKTRYDIRKSETKQLQFIVANNRKYFDEFVRLKTIERKMMGETVREAPDFYDDHWNYLQKEGYEKLFLAQHDDKTLAGILNLIFNGNAVQHGVTVPENREILGGPFLTWNTIKWCIENGCLTYDMGGINSNPENEKEKSLAFYKSKWGGKKYDYMRYTKIFSGTKWKISAGLKNPKKIKKLLKK